MNKHEQDQDWIEQFDDLLSQSHFGAFLSDYPDDEIDAILQMRALGMTPAEAHDVLLNEINEVE